MLLHAVRSVQIREILDIGAGTGFFSDKLLRQTTARSALCVDPAYNSERDTSVVGKSLLFRRAFVKSQADLVLLMDVLEHVDDDLGLLVDVVEKVATGAFFVITVPAFQSLWSDHDVFLEHRRRYRLEQLEAVVEAAGLRRLCGCYFYGSLLPVAAATRWLGRLGRGGVSAPRSQLRKHYKVVNEAFATVCRLELAWYQHNRLAGLTALCLARKE
ncbi:methyltransferase domain-containing protein [Thiohalocapsa marina]|nr:methyltransferase domain-containing protein [Thiohalocapsa marina]